MAALKVTPYAAQDVRQQLLEMHADLLDDCQMTTEEPPNLRILNDATDAARKGQLALRTPVGSGG